MPHVPTRKTRPTHAPYKPRQRHERKKKDAPKTSAQPVKKRMRENLTLYDWMTVFKFVDEHPSMSQLAIVKYFATRPEGALKFTQGTLSRNLIPERRAELEARVSETPNALSSKRPHVVTRPDVEKALFLWVKHMEGKGEVVNGPMLVTKRAKFEERFNVPDNERLRGESWIASFCRTYKIKEYRRHGEAGSVDLEAVEAERRRLLVITSSYDKKDIVNFDETSMFAFAPPDRGLCTAMMKGKKKDKFRITLGVACNADGSLKLPLFYIGKSKNPRCFKKISPQKRGFYYRNNQKAWMTAILFEEWIKQVDMQMRNANRHILLLIDNFSGHYINYQPQNIRLEYFEPNLTSFVQPCDAGIIRCVKAHYRRAYCLRAIELDEADERDIYKIDLLEAMLMMKEAWKAVTTETIQHCWHHTQILPSTNTHANSGPPMETRHETRMTQTPEMKGWDVIREFAVTSMTLPQAEDKLNAIFGTGYVDEAWRPTLNAVLEAENDELKALEAVEKLAGQTNIPIAVTVPKPTTLPPHSAPPQLQAYEEELVSTVNELKARKRIVGTPLTLEEMLNPIEEQEIGDLPYRFEGGDDEIVAIVLKELDNNNGVATEVDESDDEEGEDGDDSLTTTQVLKLCEQMESLCIKHGSFETSLDLAKHLRKYRIHLAKEQAQKAKQTTLDNFFQSW